MTDLLEALTYCPPTPNRHYQRYLAAVEASYRAEHRLRDQQAVLFNHYPVRARCALARGEAFLEALEEWVVHCDEVLELLRLSLSELRPREGVEAFLRQSWESWSPKVYEAHQLARTVQSWIDKVKRLADIAGDDCLIAW